MSIRRRPWLVGMTVGFTLGAVLGAASVSRGAFGRGDADVQARLAALEALTQHLKVVEGPLNGVVGPHLIFEGVNLHVRSGTGNTEDQGFDAGSLSGLGNLIVGYNELPDGFLPEQRLGSHNVIIGPEHRYTSVGALLAGFGNRASGQYASVSGGRGGTASGLAASVAGGERNTAGGTGSAVSGGSDNLASSPTATVGGGAHNTAAAEFCWLVNSAPLNAGCP